MKIYKNIFLSGLFVICASITISQISHTATATDSVLLTSPITSAITPTQTPTSTPTNTPTPTPTNKPQNNNQSSNNSNNSSNNSNNSSNNSNKNSGNNNSNVCNSTKPGTPSIIGISYGARNTVTVRWTKVHENVTYYVIAYSRKPGIIEYATPNLSSGSTSFTIGGIARGATFYFKVRAGNGCKPGDFSREAGIRGNGQMFFTQVYIPPAVLGKSTKTAINKKKPVAKPTVSKVKKPAAKTGKK